MELPWRLMAFGKQGHEGTMSRTGHSSLLAAKRNSTVLVVEDEILIRLLIGEELRASGFLVLEAANADEAVELLHSGQRIEAVVSDVNMPGSMDGIALTTLVRATFPEIKIIVASGHVPASREVHADNCLKKPYQPEELVTCLNRLLGRTAASAS
jgi:CheY-like chemotaxis protein